MIKKLLAIIIILIVFIVCWQLLEDVISTNRISQGRTGLEAFIPSPLTIYKTFVSYHSTILQETFFTLKRALAGFALGTAFAIIVATLFLVFPMLRTVSFPMAMAMNSFPIVGLAPVIILLFGQGSTLSIVFISTLICYFPTLVNLDTAFRETDKELLELMYVFKASTLQTMTKVRFPLALPYLFSSMKLAIPASIIGATMGEWLGSRNGIGQLITISLYQLKPGLLYSSLLTITLISLLGILLMGIIERFVLPWKKSH